MEHIVEEVNKNTLKFKVLSTVSDHFLSSKQLNEYKQKFASYMEQEYTDKLEEICKLADEEKQKIDKENKEMMEKMKKAMEDESEKIFLDKPPDEELDSDDDKQLPSDEEIIDDDPESDLNKTPEQIIAETTTMLCSTAYKKIARVAHPDKCRDDPVKTKLFQVAKKASECDDVIKMLSVALFLDIELPDMDLYEDIIEHHLMLMRQRTGAMKMNPAWKWINAGDHGKKSLEGDYLELLIKQAYDGKSPMKARKDMPKPEYD